MVANENAELNALSEHCHFSTTPIRKVKEVYALETRPLLQGARLTMWELKREGIPATLVTDSMAAPLMAQGKVDFVITGADRIAKNGDTANKIGTLTLALLSHYFKIPFFIAAPISTFDPEAKSGDNIPIEERDPDEIKICGEMRIAPKETRALNYAFDVTPSDLITGIITEKGILYPPYKKSIGKILKR
jgi:methylthioribose-1-phosphate isomerase